MPNRHGRKGLEIRLCPRPLPVWGISFYTMKSSTCFARLGTLSRCLLLAALTLQAASAETGSSILAKAASGVGLPLASHDFTRIAPGAEFVPNQVLVRFKNGVQSVERAQILSALGGARITRQYEMVPSLCLVTLPAGQTVAQALVAYNGMPGILYAEPDYLRHTCATFPNDPLFGQLWGMRNTGQTGGAPGADIHATQAWDISTGSRQVVVAVIDTGVDYTHPDLTNNIWTNLGEIPGNGIDDDGNGYVDDVHGYDFYNNDGNPMDDNDHGTHCAGTIGAEGNNNLGVVGVCWQVRIMAVKIFGSGGSSSTSDEIAAIQYATRMGAQVISASWGGFGYSQALKDSIDGAGAANIIFVAAAGNTASDNDVFPHYPASFTSPNIVAVMSTDQNDLRSDFSCFGLTAVDLAAPGSEILSCQPGGLYQYMSGTSMATPHVAGACGLALSVNPMLTVAQLKQALLSTADRVVPGLCVSGGRMNLNRFLNNLPSSSPLVLYTNYLSGGNGNGIIDFNECNNLNVVLTNLGNTTVTGVRASLSTTTPGVAIAQPNSIYIDIPGGAVGTNLIPFKVSTTPSFVCGTPVDFSVVVKSDQSVAVYQFTLPSGLPGSPFRFDNNAAVPIPSPGSAASSILVSNISFAVSKVTVSMFVEAYQDFFLRLELIAPDGTTNVLSPEYSLIGQNFGLTCSPDSQRTTFDDAAATPITSGVAPFLGSFRPTQALAVYNGKSGTNVNGVWQLRVTDLSGYNMGSIQCWSLAITPTLCVDGGGQCPGSDLALGMTAQPSPIIAGNNLTYTISVTNNGPSSATNVSTTFILPSSALFVSASSSQGSFAQSGGLITFNLGPINPAGKATMTVVALPMAPGTIFATATVTSEQPDFVPANNSATVLAQVNPPTADLSVAMASAPNPGLVARPLTYTVSVANNGPSPASDITVTNALPVNSTFQSATGSMGSFVVAGNIVFWRVPGLAVGGNATATLTIVPTAEGSFPAIASVGGAQFDPILGNNTATVNTVIGPASDMAIGVADFPNPVVAGSNLTFAVVITNLGPSTASGIIVNDLLSPGMNVLSAAPSQGFVTVSNSVLVWTVGTLSNSAKAALTFVVGTTTNGTLRTTATVIAAQSDPNPANNSATTSTVVAAPFIAIAPAAATLIYESGPVNGAVDPGETVTVLLRLRDIGNIGTRNLVGTLLTNAGVRPLAPNNPQTYGVLAPSGFPVGRSFSFTASGTNGQTITATLQLADGATSYPPVNFNFTLPTTSAFAAASAITIPNPAAPNPPYPPMAGPASPYPSTIAISNLSGVLGKVTVTLSNLSHTYPSDVNVLLVAPNGVTALLMSYAGDQASSGVNLTLDDAAAAPLPPNGALTTGTWRPAAYNSTPLFPTNAPPGPYGTTLASFNSINPNGLWSLYVFDGGSGDDGAILGGWSLSLTMITPVNQLADLGISGVAVPNPCLAGDALAYTFTITNAGPNTATSVAFTNVLPAGVRLISAIPSQGTLYTNGSSVIGSLGSLSSGTNILVTLLVTPTAATIPFGATNAILTNTANVAAYETDLNPANNIASVTTALRRPITAATVTLSSLPDPVVVGYYLTNIALITNIGPDKAINAVLTQVLPPGAGLVGVSSSVGSCTNFGGVISCALGDLASNTTATVTIILTNSVAGLMTNRVDLTFDSYDPNPANHSAVHVTTVVNPSPAIIAAGATLTYESGPVNGAVDPGETVTLVLSLANLGTLDTSNLKATLLPSGGVTLPTAPQYYGTLIQGGPSAARSFGFKASATPGTAVVATLQLQDERPGVTNNLGTVAFTFSLPVASAWSNTAAMTIPSYGVATPYPSSINVTGLVGRLSKATVTLNGLSHTFPHDINVLLVSPSGSNVLVMSHTGGGNAATNLTLTFDDAAASSLPNYNPLSSGTFRPSSYEGPVALPGTASPQSYQFALAGLNWSEPNGAWLLYVYDDSAGDGGFIARGWSLSLTTLVTVGPVVDLALTLSSSPAALNVGGTLTNTINIRNLGPDWATGVTLTNPLPAGVNFVSATLSQGTISGTIGGPLVCSLGNLAAGSGARVTVVLSPTSAGSFTNLIVTAADEEDLNQANNTVQTRTTVVDTRPATLQGVISNGQFHLIVTAQPNTAYAILGSTNLSLWNPLSTNTTSAEGVIDYTDTDSSTLTQRYYRTQRLEP